MESDGKTVGLKIGSTKELENKLRITLNDIIHEELAEAPGYPGGSGMVVVLALSINGKTSTMTLDQLPEGYESNTEKEWEGFQIRLVEITGEETIRILIRKSLNNSDIL